MKDLSNETYHVWCPDLGEAEEDNRLIVAYDHEEAGKEFVEKEYHEEPFDSPMVVMVRNHLGGLFRVSVYPEPAIHFYAYVEEVPA